MNTIDKYLAPHANAVSLRQQRMEVLASNIANAATPNYKARDIDFKAVLGNVRAEDALRTTNQKHFPVTNSVADRNGLMSS